MKSIVYQDQVNLDNCESEPIHIPGSIQPHGFLLAVDSDHILRFCSENIREVGFDPARVLGQKLSLLFNSDDYQKIAEALEKPGYTKGQVTRLKWAGKDINLLTHQSDTYHILEIEPFTENEIPFLNSLSFEFARLTGEAKNLKELCQKISKHIKEITGYDRVMIYKFDDQYNGEVFAESKEEHLESFLGLHYPHTDIPPQARELYLKNLVRMISDVDYKPVPILSLDTQGTHESLNLGMSVLRSVSPIHVSYLQNMGVGATLTVSLLLDDRLWGLVACHHYSPKTLSFYSRISALLQGQLLSSQIRVQETAVSFEEKRSLEIHLDAIRNMLSSENNEDLHSDDFLHVTQSDYFLCTSSLTPVLIGSESEKNRLKEIIRILDQMNVDEFHTNSVVRDLHPDPDSDIAGVLYFRLDEHTRVIWARREVNREIKWAGNPHKAIEKDQNGLSPRKSFEAWKEVIRGKSRNWTDVEISVARQCVFMLQKHHSLLKGRQVQRQQEELLDKLKLANEELENINWISTHDLKEPLRKIRIFASLLLDDTRFELEEDTLKMIDRINNSAGRMQRLLDDLLHLNRTKHTEESYETIRLGDLLTGVIETFDWNKGRVRLADPMPEIKGNAFLLSQLFTNLISNSLKFASEKRELLLEIDQISSEQPGFVTIRLTDNGMGFENKYAESMFRVFFRLNDDFQREGSGVGLAICKKVVELHGGRIWSEGTPELGASFYVELPLAS